MIVERTEDGGNLTLALRFYVDRVSLHLDKGACIGCDICAKVCPKEAISIESEDNRLQIAFDESRCVLCGACEPLCPSNAITMRFNDQQNNLLIDRGGFPTPTSKLSYEASVCPEKGADAARACPRGALTVLEDSVVVDQTRCLRCPWCADACGHGAINVRPLFLGGISIIGSKCPPGCDACSRVCPTSAIRMASGKAFVQARYCIFCNACSLICKYGAIDLTRRGVLVKDGFSAIWSSALAKLLDAGSSARVLDNRSRMRLKSLVVESKVV